MSVSRGIQCQAALSPCGLDEVYDLLGIGFGARSRSSFKREPLQCLRRNAYTTKSCFNTVQRAFIMSPSTSALL